MGGSQRIRLSHFLGGFRSRLKLTANATPDGNKLGSFEAHPHWPFSRAIAVSATEIFVGDIVGGFATTQRSPFSQKIAIGFKDKRDCNLRWK